MRLRQRCTDDRPLVAVVRVQQLPNRLPLLICQLQGIWFCTCTHSLPANPATICTLIVLLPSQLRLQSSQQVMRLRQRCANHRLVFAIVIVKQLPDRLPLLVCEL